MLKRSEASRLFGHSKRDPSTIVSGSIGWGDALMNWLMAGLGNLVGAVVFVATSYWYLFLRDQPAVRARAQGRLDSASASRTP